MTYSLFKHEVYTIFSNKRYLLSLGVQLLILFAILPVFSGFLSTGSISITSPALNEFIPISIVDDSENSYYIRRALENNQKIEIVELERANQADLERGIIAAILLIPDRYDESINRVLEIELLTHAPGLKGDAVYDAVYPSILETSEILTAKRIEAFDVTIENPVAVEKKYFRPLVVDSGENKFSSFFLTYLVPLMLFFPIFTVGSIILDSVVGERERKTVESILVSPVKREEIVLSKFLSTSLFVILQLLLWLVILKMYGAPLQNVSQIFFFVILIDSAIIATAQMLAYYSRTVKEANILLMLLYTSVFTLLIVSLSINYFNSSLAVSPFNIVSNLVVGNGNIGFFWPFALLLFTGITLTANSYLIQRDDVVFGPRPSLSNLLEDLSFDLFSSGKLGYLYLTSVFGAFAIIYSTLIEIFLGVFLIFVFGLTNILIPIFALVEELIKPVGIYFLTSRQSISVKSGVVLGVLSGVMFFALESIVFITATYLLFPSLLLQIFRVRLATTLIVHAVSSGIVGYGIVKKQNFVPALLVATLIHALFNLVVTGGVM